jgi:predicted nucleotidyltransferase
MRELENTGMHISSVHLFGSCANDTASEESDIDIAIISSDFRGIMFSKRFHLLGSALIRITQKYQVPIDIIPLTPEEFEQEKSLRMDFIRQGREITINPDHHTICYANV